MTIQTLNATVAQIEDALRSGQKVEDVARDLSEPRNNVIAIWSAMRQRGDLHAVVTATAPAVAPVANTSQPEAALATTAPTSAPPVVPAKPVHTPDPHLTDRIAATTDLLVRAADIDDKRIQSALASARKALVTLAGRVEAWESQGAARQRIARLEAELRIARAEIRKPGSSESAPRRPISEERRAQLRAQFVNTEPCAHGCGRVSTTKAGKAAHERACTGPAA